MIHMTVRSLLVAGVIAMGMITAHAAWATGAPPGVGNASQFAPIPNDTYFTIRQDQRKCMSPMCGGWWVKVVNRKKMRCLDGSVNAECYVGTDKVAIPNLTDTQTFELRQAMAASKALLQAQIFDDVPYGLLTINRAWLSATDQAPAGIFVNVKDNGIRCITYPCLSLDAEILNRNLVKAIADLDLNAVGASDKQLELARQAMQGDDGLPMAGKFTEVSGPAGVAQGFAASQFFLPLIGEAVAFCHPTGCSGQICADSDVMTSCEWRPEYACYRGAICTAQNTGDCGWVMDDALKQCLAKAATSALIKLR